MYDIFKALDPGRIWDTTSGWFKETKSDVESEHIYFKPLRFKASSDSSDSSGRPLVLSEFGGYSLKLAANSANPDNTYGYRFFTEAGAFSDALERLYLDEVVGAIRSSGLCASILTQVSDVEDETNGLWSYDRQVLKVDRDRMQRIASALGEAFRTQ